MEKFYTASLTSRFNGMYYSVRYLDFDDFRGRDLEPEDITSGKYIQLLEVELQNIVNEMSTNGKPIPEPSLTKYENVICKGSISFAGYIQIKVLIPN